MEYARFHRKMIDWIFEMSRLLLKNSESVVCIRAKKTKYFILSFSCYRTAKSRKIIKALSVFLTGYRPVKNAPLVGAQICCV